MSSQIITIDNVESKLITIDNIATEVVTVETVEIITIEGVGATGPPGASGVWGEINGDILTQTDLQTEQGLQDTAIQQNATDIANLPPPVWGNITGTLSDQTDLKNQQDAQDSAIALNTAKRSYPLADENRLANTSGTNTGDQDISGIIDNSDAIDTINETAIFVDPLSPQDVELNWKGNNIEYDALTPSASTIHFILQLQTLLTATVTGDQNVEGGDTEIYSATYTGTADDVTYLWTVTGSAFANINGSDTGQTVTVDYTQGVEIENVDIKCVLTSVNAQSSAEDTLTVELIPAGFVAWQQSFKVDDPSNDVLYGVDPLVAGFVDYGTLSQNLTQGNPTNQAELIEDVTPADNVARFGSDSYYDGVEPQAVDFTFEWTLDMTNALGVGASLLFSPTQGRFTKGSNDTFTLRSEQASNKNFPNFVMTGGMKTIRLVKEGTDFRLYSDGILVDSLSSVTGTFSTMTRLGNSSAGMLSDLKTFKVYNSAENP